MKKDPIKTLLAAIPLFGMGCSSISAGQDQEENPHFEYSEAYFYRWTSGAPGGPRGKDHIFKFVPENGLDPEFKKITLHGEMKDPDISRRGDTIVLMVQRTGGIAGQGKSGRSGKEKDGDSSDKRTFVEYALKGNVHRYRIDTIPEKQKSTKYR